MDPVTLDRIAPANDNGDETEHDELRSRRRKRYWIKRYEALLDHLPRVERELVHLNLVRELPQRQVALLYGVSRPAITQRVARAMDRLRWLADWPGVGITQAQLERDLWGVFPAATRRLLWTLLSTTSQSEAGRAVGRRQGYARSVARQAVDRMRPEPRLRRYYLAVRGVLDRPGMLIDTSRAIEPYAASSG